MIQLEQLQAAIKQSRQYVWFWSAMIRKSRSAKMRYYCMRRYDTALRLSMGCNQLVLEYLGYVPDIDGI